jgi:hypothetical protein
LILRDMQLFVRILSGFCPDLWTTNERAWNRMGAVFLTARLRPAAQGRGNSMRPSLAHSTVLDSAAGSWDSDEQKFDWSGKGLRICAKK